MMSFRPVHAVHVVRVSAAAVGAVAVGLALPATASAHVTVSPGEAEAGSFAVLTVSVPHGCETSPTTEVAIDIPKEVVAITPTVNPNWEVEALAADGSPAEGMPVARVVYTADTPLPSHLRDTFELSATMPEEAGQTLAFPITQTCEEGSTEWAEIPDEGQDPHELELPAPLVQVVAPADESGGHGSGDDAEESGDVDGGEGEAAGGADGDDSGSVADASDDAGAEGDMAGDDDGSEVTAMNVASLSTGIVGIILGGAALIYAYRRTRSTGTPTQG